MLYAFCDVAITLYISFQLSFNFLPQNNKQLARLVKTVLNPSISVYDKTTIKCGYAHPGIFTRFLEHIGLEQSFTILENKNSLVLIQDRYFLLP